MNKNKKFCINPVAIILGIVFITGIVFEMVPYLNQMNKQREYESLAEAARQTTEAVTITEAEEETAIKTETEPETEPETDTYNSIIDFAALSAKNPDIVAWLTIPGTNIDYPVVQSSDNEKYLHTDFDGNKSVTGTIYLDCDDQPDMSSLHNIFYGHHMKNGSMFKDIVNFKDKSFFDSHRDIILYTPEKEYHLKTMACLYTTPDGIRRKNKFITDEEFQLYIDQMTKDCQFRIMPEETIGQIFSFVTCSYEKNDIRTILYAYVPKSESN